MAKSKTNPEVDWFFEKAGKWQKEMGGLREIALGSGLSEVLKWGCPCYALDERNIVLIHAFKDYCAFLFFKGALLRDPEKLLIQQTANVQSARQIRFTSAKEIGAMKGVLRAYIRAAIEVEQSGAKVEFKKTTQFEMPPEFRKALSEDSALRDAFSALTPGRQRGYLLHFSSAKQAKTRVARIEKCIPMIFDGVGWNE